MDDFQESGLSLASHVGAGAHEGSAIEIKTVGDLIVAYLEQLDVQYVFGIPGGAIEPLYNALAVSERKHRLRHILTRHESGSAAMADGFSRETGKIGVCCATSGPGATNLITGVACAYDNNIPLLVITGQPALPAFGKNPLQESSCTGINTVGMFKHCTRYNSLVSHPKQVEAKIVAAVQRAMRTPRGPAHLSIPVDLLRSPSPVSKLSYDLRKLLEAPSLIDVEQMGLLLEQVLPARKIVLLIGGWCGEAIGLILQFAAMTKAEIITTPEGKGLINPWHPQFRGVFGFAGHASAEQTLRDNEVDLVVAVGTSMGEWNSGGWCDSVLNGRLIHIDESEENLAHTPMARLHVRGRILSVFNHLNEQLRLHRPEINDTTKPKLSNKYGFSLLSEQKYTDDQGPIKPQRLMHDLGRLFPPNTRFLADAGGSVPWAVHYLHLSQDRRQGERRVGGKQKRITLGKRQTDAGWFRLTVNFASMGWAIGACVGIGIAAPNNPVVCITGDGSMLMNGQELSVAVAEQLPIIFVVLNDQALGMVKHGQRLAKAESIAYQLPATDFAMLARALGAQAFTIQTAQDMAALDIKSICQRKGPTLLDVYIDPSEVPPMSARVQMLNDMK